MRSLEKQHKTPPIHSYAPAYNPIKPNPSQLSITRTIAAFLKSACHPLGVHCQSTTASCMRLPRQSEVSRYREIVPIHEKPQELHRSVSCRSEAADLQCSVALLLNDFQLFLQQMLQAPRKGGETLLEKRILSNGLKGTCW